MLSFVQVSKYFKPEFLNRLTEVVIFEPLSRDMLKEVVKVQMKKIVAGVSDKGISLSTTDAALDVILEESYNPVSTSHLHSSVIEHISGSSYHSSLAIF